MAKINGDINSDTFITNRNRFNELSAKYAPTSSLTPKRTPSEQTELEGLISTFDTDGVVLTASEANQVINETTENFTTTQTFTDNIFHSTVESRGWADRATRTYNGQTLINLLGEVGGFHRDTDGNGLADGWLSLSVSGLSLANNIQNFTPVAQTGRILVSNLTFVNNHIYYVSSDINSDSTSTRFFVSGLALDSHGGSGRFERISLRFTGSGSTTLMGIDSNLTSGWTQIQVKNVMIIDLTQMYGSGNEPTQAQMDLVPFFNNSAHFGGVLRSVGKNLFDNQLTNETIVNGVIFPNPNVVISNFIRIEPNNSYSLSGTTENFHGLYWYDVNLNFISNTFLSATLPFQNQISPSNAYYVRTLVQRNSTLPVDEARNGNYQLENNSVSTVYQPYQERQQIVPSLRSVGNGTNVVRDTLEGNVIIRRTIEDFNNLIKNSVAGDWTRDQQATNTVRYTINIVNMGLIESNPTSNILIGYIKIGNKIINFSSSNTGSTNDSETAAVLTTGLLVFRIERTFADTIDELIQQFQDNDVELVFQAPNPYIENPTTDGNIYAFSSGQIQNEGIVPVQSISVQFPTSQASEVITSSQTIDSTSQIADRLAVLQKVHATTGTDSYFVNAFDGFEFEDGDLISLRFGNVNTGASSINGFDLLTEDGSTQTAGNLQDVQRFEFRNSGDSERFIQLPSGRVNAEVEQFDVTGDDIARGDFVFANRATGNVELVSTGSTVDYDYDNLNLTTDYDSFAEAQSQVLFKDGVMLIANNRSATGITVRTLSLETNTVISSLNIGSTDYIRLDLTRLNDTQAIVTASSSVNSTAFLINISSNNVVTLSDTDTLENISTTFISVARITDSIAVVHYAGSGSSNQTIRQLTVSGSSLTVQAATIHQSSFNATFNDIARQNDTRFVISVSSSTQILLKYYQLNGTGFTQIGSTVTIAANERAHLMGTPDGFDFTTPIYYVNTTSSTGFGAITLTSTTISAPNPAFLVSSSLSSVTVQTILINSSTVLLTARRAISPNDYRALLISDFTGSAGTPGAEHQFASVGTTTTAKLHPVKLADFSAKVLIVPTGGNFATRTIDFSNNSNGIAGGSGESGDTINVFRL